MLWITAALLVCSAEGRYLQQTLQNSYIQSPEGVEACNRVQPADTKKYISSKFFNDHICLLKEDHKEPDNIAGLCRDFRNAKKSTIMVLTSQQLTDLSNDIQGHQADYSSYYRKCNRKPIFYTDWKYDFVQCDNVAVTSEWNRDYYERYGAKMNSNGVYQIYHGCRAVQNSPGFFDPDNC